MPRKTLRDILSRVFHLDTPIFLEVAMKRHSLLVGVIVLTLGATLLDAQGRGRGQGAGQGQAVNNNNSGMPWEALRAAVMIPWEGVPFTAQKTEPFKVFDNISYVGVETVGSYVINTSGGLILIDSTYAETADHVLDGVRKLGFDPSNIKYMLITHQHNDHFGGAARIKQQVPGARVGASLEDWDAIEKGTMIARDLVITDGDTLKLGDTTLKFYVLPGHTVGNLATEIQARGNGKSYRTLVGLAFAPAPGMTAASITSTERLEQLGPWDALLTSHSYLAPVAIPLTAQQILLSGAPDATRKPTGHPAAVGPERINAYFDQILKATRDRLAREQARPPQ